MLPPLRIERPTPGTSPEPEPGSIEEVYAILPWLGTPPHREAPGPESGSIEELLSIMPWLSEDFRLDTPTGSELGSLEELLELLPWLALPKVRVVPRTLDDIEMDDDEGMIAFVLSQEGNAVAETEPPRNVASAASGPADPHHTFVGMNAPKVLEYSVDSDSTGRDESVRVYGTTSSILSDLQALGVGFFRQPSGCDPTWPRDTDPATGLPIPVDVPGITDDPATGGGVLYAQVFGTSGSPGDLMKSGLIELFEAMPAGQRVVLTLFSSGGNRFTGTDSSGEYPIDAADPTLTDGPRSIPWPSADHDPGTKSITWWDGTSIFHVDDYISIRDMYTDLVAGSITDFSAALTYVARSYSPSDTTDTAWWEATLDLRCPYKLKYLYYIGYAYGLLLLDVNTSAGGGIWDKIEAIEVFNEINGVNKFSVTIGADKEMVEAQARFWALAVREMVRGLQKAFSDRFAEGNPRKLPLWLPSLETYSAVPAVGDIGTNDIVANGAPTFATVLYFQEKLLYYLVKDFAEDTVTEYPVDFTWFVNQDYHFYHYKEHQAAGTILRLAAELQALRRTMDTTVATTAGDTSVVDLAGHHVTISVCETGASADGANIDKTVFKYMSSLGTGADRFQAREVWRRLAVAATGARRIAWHTHMSYVDPATGDTSGFNYLGLHEDAVISPPDNPNNSVQRLSWWAFQRFTEKLVVDAGAPARYAGQVLARFVNVLPNTLDHDQRYVNAAMSDIHNVAIAIHFLRSPAEHWYLIMLDPAADLAAPYQVTIKTLDGAAAHFYEWQSIPEYDANDARMLLTYPDGTAIPPTDGTSLPTASPGYSGWTSGTELGGGPLVSYTFTVQRDNDPYLFCTSAPCTVAWHL